MRWILLACCFLISGHVHGVSCGPIDATYPVFSATSLKIDRSVRANNQNVSSGTYRTNRAITTAGRVQSVSYSVPGIAPVNFPTNNSSTDINHNASPVVSTTEVFYDKVELGRAQALTLSGGGPFHIDKLIINDDADLTLAAGTYYINELEGGNAADLIIEGDVKIHIGKDLTLDDYFDANLTDNNVGDLVIILHENADVEFKYAVQIAAALIGVNNGDIKFGEYIDFYGTVVSDGPIEIGRLTWFYLYSSYITSIEARTTCIETAPDSNCGPPDISYVLYAKGNIEVGASSTINGSRLSRGTYNAGSGFDRNGTFSTSSMVIAEVRPRFLPTNSATADINNASGTITSNSAVFYDKITVRNNRTLTFVGDGPFHIDELELKDNATVTLSGANFYFRKITGGRNSEMRSGTFSRVHIGEEWKTGENATIGFNARTIDNFVLLHDGAKLEIESDTDFRGIIVGDLNDEVILKDDTFLNGMVLSGGTILLEDSVEIELSSNQQRAVRDSLTTCQDLLESGVVGFILSHDGSGINCLGETVTVTAVDGQGDTVTDYGEQITLTTQTGNGSYSLISGNGSFSDPTTGDGLMLYTFDVSDLGTASFSLSYEEGANSFDLDSFQSSDTTIRDDDSEGNLTFAPSGFTVTKAKLGNPPPAVINDPIDSQIAGTQFVIHLAAFGQTPADPTCGIIEAYSGAQDLAFWVDYVNPGSGILAPTIDGLDIAASEASASSQSVSFVEGQANIKAKYKDVGAIQIELKDGDIRGASASFVVKPADFAVTLVEDSSNNPNPGASDMLGVGFVAAGEAFSVNVEARDAEGSRTPNYGNESPPEGLQISAGALVAPAGGFNGSANDGAMGNSKDFSAITPAGTFRNTNASWDETGVMKLQVHVADGEYLGEGDVIGNLSAAVGRFTPHEFTLASGFVSGSCNNRTYMGQPSLAVSYQLEARGVAANILQNYDVALAGAAALANLNLVAEENDSGVNLGSRLSVPVSGWINGVRSVSSSIEQFSRAATPDGPFASLNLGMQVSDGLDNLPVANADMNPATSGDCVIAGNCDARALGAATEMYYGRFEVQNSFGPETAPLELGLRAMVFDGSDFVVNTSDDCTSYQSSGASLSNYQGGLPVVSIIAPTSATGLVDGVNAVGSGLMLSSPGAANTGSVDVTYDAPGWLEFDWQGSGLEDPRGTATFGQFRGHDKVIYWREVF